MLLLFSLISIIKSQPEDFVTFGLTSKFAIIPDTFTDCLNTLCYSIICKRLSNDTLCLNYMVIVPLLKYIDCHKFSSSILTTMIVFAIDPNKKINITDVTICQTMGGCFSKGCEIANDHHGDIWIVLTGQCY